MDEVLEELQCRGLLVRLQWPAPAAALRYFSPTGRLAQGLRATGVTLPQTGQARQSGRELVLAWRSPTETLCLATTPEALQGLRQSAAGAADGSFVELTGALAIVELAGERIADLLCRLGGTASQPLSGESRRSRMADVPVLALSVREGEVCLVIERTFAEHLLGWIRATVRDFS